MSEQYLEVPNRMVPSPALRNWVYGVLIAVGGLLVALGVLQDEVWVQVVNVLAAVFVIGGGALARANTPEPAKE